MPQRPRALRFVVLFLALGAGAGTSARAASAGTRGGPAGVTEIGAFRAALDARDMVLADSLGMALLPRLARRPAAEQAALYDRWADLRMSRSLVQSAEDMTYRLTRAAVALRESSAADSAGQAAALLRLGRCLRDRQHPDSATATYRRALAIEERLNGPGSWGASVILNGLGRTLWAVGDYAEALAALDRALAIRSASRPPGDPDVCQIESNIAVVLTETGDYARARRLFEHVLSVYDTLAGRSALYEQKAGEQSNNLGVVLLRMGDLRGASAQLERSFEIRRRTLGMQSSETSEVLDDLAQVKLEQGDTLAALADWRQALASVQGTVPKGHRDLAGPLDRLGALALARGQLDSAEVMLEEALALRVRSHGPAHPEVAETLRELAGLDRIRARPDSARARIERSLAITLAALGPDHPDEALARLELAALERDAGRPGRALVEALEAERIGAASVRLSIRVMPEEEALACARRRPSGLDLALSVLAGSPHGDEAAWAAWDMVVRSRALVLDEMASRHRALVSDTDSVSRCLFERMVAARRRMTELAFAGPGATPPERYRALLAGARAEGDEAELRLAERVEPFAAARAQASVGLSAVRGALPPDAALVSFVRYREWPRGLLGATRQARYIAFVLPPGHAAARAIPLGDAETIEAAAARWRTAVDASGSAATAGAERAMRSAGIELRRRVWDPLAAAVASARLVVVVPDGAIQLVDLAALPDPDDPRRFLIERRQPFHYLSAERDAAMPRTGHLSAGSLVMGGVDFERDVPDPAAPAPALVAAYRGPAPGCEDFARLRFEPLPATGREADEVARLLAGLDGAQRTLTGAAAGEASFKREAPRSALVHVASHGFFLDLGCVEDAGLPAGFSSNPLLRSGVALAGANRRGQAPGGEDGILTAEEIASLDLTGTSWVVLSACHSGVGEPVAGEGVLGLRRAVQVAGARTLVLGLWRVDDAASRRWMRALYTSRIRGRRDTARAVMEASLETLAECRRRGQRPSPAAWAPFIAAGDWR